MKTQISNQKRKKNRSKPIKNSEAWEPDRSKERRNQDIGTRELIEIHVNERERRRTWTEMRGSGYDGGEGLALGAPGLRGRREEYIATRGGRGEMRGTAFGIGSDPPPAATGGHRRSAPYVAREKE